MNFHFEFFLCAYFKFFKMFNTKSIKIRVHVYVIFKGLASISVEANFQHIHVSVAFDQ